MIKDLLERITTATISSCNCGTKTPDVNYHKETCRYRVLEECYRVLSKIQDALDER